jgi:tRNA pseudouridine38-40 synthase
MRIALGLSYAGQAYQGWQSQPSGLTVQDQLEAALKAFACEPLQTLCAGRTDAGVHGLMQVVHFDTAIEREPFSWVRGTNRFLPPDIAVQWAHPVPDRFHARASARSRFLPGALAGEAVDARGHSTPCGPFRVRARFSR